MLQRLCLLTVFTTLFLVQLRAQTDILMTPSEAASSALGGQIGDAAASFHDYNNLRNQHKSKIAQLEAAVASATGARQAELKAELEYWKGINTAAQNAEKEMLDAMSGAGVGGLGGSKLQNFDDLKRGFADLIQNWDQIKADRAYKKRIDELVVRIGRYYQLAEKMPQRPALKRARQEVYELDALYPVSRAVCFRQAQQPAYQQQVAAMHQRGEIASPDAFIFSMVTTDPLTRICVRAQTESDNQFAVEWEKELAELAPLGPPLEEKLATAEKQAREFDDTVKAMSRGLDRLRQERRVNNLNEAGKAELQAGEAKLQAFINSSSPDGAERLQLQSQVTRWRERKSFLEDKLNTSRARKFYQKMDIKHMATATNPPDVNELRKWAQEAQ